MLQLLTNRNGNAHIKVLRELISEANSVYIMVAFLKNSGLNMLLPLLHAGQEVSILAGANFGITEPDALTRLLKESRQRKNFTAYLNRLDSKRNFHPKMYLIRKGTTAHVLIGSANLTSGGFEGNEECSLLHQCSITDQVWMEAIGMFQKSILPSCADALKERIISIYKAYYLRQKPNNSALKEFADLRENDFYNLAALKAEYDRLDKKKIARDLQEKELVYAEAKKVLEKLATKEHRDEVFKDLIEDLVGKEKEKGLWYSNGMFRHKEHIFKQQAQFRALINTIKSNLGERPHIIYGRAREVSRTLLGVGPNFIGEIMMTYAPSRLANINRNPITVLRDKGDISWKSHSQHFNGTDYEDYNKVVQEICDKLGIKNMLAADYFFNEIYQDMKKGK